MFLGEVGMNKWKRLQILALLMVFSLLAAACSGGNGGTGTSTGNSTSTKNNTQAEGGSADNVKLRIMWWGSQPRHEATLKALEAYTAKNPHVTFEPEYSGMDGYLDKLSTQAAAQQ